MKAYNHNLHKIFSRLQRLQGIGWGPCWCCGEKAKVTVAQQQGGARKFSWRKRGQSPHAIPATWARIDFLVLGSDTNSGKFINILSQYGALFSQNYACTLCFSKSNKYSTYSQLIAICANCSFVHVLLYTVVLSCGCTVAFAGSKVGHGTPASSREVPSLDPFLNLFLKFFRQWWHIDASTSCRRRKHSSQWIKELYSVNTM